MVSTPALRVRDLTKTYAGKGGDVHALKGVSFDVRQGEIFGLLGPNGAGKTTLIHILAGLTLPSDGDAFIAGAHVVDAYKRAHGSLGLAGQEPDFDWWITTRDALIYHCGYHGIPRAVAAPRADALLKRFGLWDKRNQKVEHLSGGQKRRVLIARAAIHDPPVIILDEPTAGVDVELRHQLWDFIRELHAQGKTVILTTHYLEEAENLCERIAIINRGEIVALDSPQDLMAASERDLVVLDLDRAVKSPKDLPPALEKAFHSVSGDGRTLMLQGVEGGPLAADAVRELTQAGVTVESVSITKKKLEDVFLRLTSLREDAVRTGEDAE